MVWYQVPVQKLVGGDRKVDWLAAGSRSGGRRTEMDLGGQAERAVVAVVRGWRMEVRMARVGVMEGILVE